MSSSTTHYGLYLEGNDATPFLEWRKLVNGDDPAITSNMTLIDNALWSKADHSEGLTGVLTAEDWEGDFAPYTQTVSVSGLEADQNGNVGLAITATSAQRAAARTAIISVVGQAAGTVTFAADGNKPQIDIPFAITLQH